MGKSQARKPRRKYTAEYKRAAVELVTVSGRSYAEAAKSLGISEQTLYRWKSPAQIHFDSPALEITAATKSVRSLH